MRESEQTELSRALSCRRSCLCLPEVNTWSLNHICDWSDTKLITQMMVSHYRAFTMCRSQFQTSCEYYLTPVKVLVAQSCLIFVTPQTVAHQAALSVGFSRQEYWSGLPFPSPGDLPDPGIKPRSPTLQADSLPSELPGKPNEMDAIPIISIVCGGRRITERWIHVSKSTQPRLGQGLNPGSPVSQSMFLATPFRSCIDQQCQLPVIISTAKMSMSKKKHSKERDLD